ncbi:MAG: GNAT family N-acetyltransferase [Thermoleophilia bacterium]
MIVPEDEAGVALVPTVMEYLRRHPLGRRFLVLGPLPEESVVWKGVEAYGPSRFCARSDWSAFFIDCTMSYDRLLAGLTKNFRKNLRNNSNRLKQFGEVRFVQVSGRDGLEKELATFLDIEASGWKGEHGTGSAINLHPNLVAFYRDLAAEMLGPEDYCEICSLYAAGHCLASMFSVRTGETYATVKIGYDETFSRLGPGQALLQKTIERCCADPGIKQFDMVGTPAWVKGWQPQQKRFRQGHIAIGGIPSRLPVALLSLRFGAVRHAVRSVRRRLGR